MEIKPVTAVIHTAHLAVIHVHMAHHLPVVHPRHRLIAILFHQRLHAHHVEHRIHGELQLTLRKPGQRWKRRQRGEGLRQRTGGGDLQRLNT